MIIIIIVAMIGKWLLEFVEARAREPITAATDICNFDLPREMEGESIFSVTVRLSCPLPGVFPGFHRASVPRALLKLSDGASVSLAVRLPVICPSPHPFIIPAHIYHPPVHRLVRHPSVHHPSVYPSIIQMAKEAGPTDAHTCTRTQVHTHTHTHKHTTHKVHMHAH